jgi:AcrR family transcriptional regulator
VSAHDVPAEADRKPAHGDGRQALLDATIRVARRDGLGGITFRSVAAEAGVTNGLIVHHFGTRSALVHEALAHAARHSIDLSMLEPPEGDPTRIAARLSERIASAASEELFQFQLVIEAVRGNEVIEDARAMYDTYLEATGQALEHAGIRRSPAFTRLIFAALDGLSLQQLLYSDPAATDEALHELHELLAEFASRDATEA